jgi:hypothetical protein
VEGTDTPAVQRDAGADEQAGHVHRKEARSADGGCTSIGHAGQAQGEHDVGAGGSEVDAGQRAAADEAEQRADQQPAAELEDGEHRPVGQADGCLGAPGLEQPDGEHDRHRVVGRGLHLEDGPQPPGQR